ncbi:DUF2207 domain-containing protein [Quadrisphaera setariae]|uniref:DUF2207 domain-containing protein n=1 Tax=Quadrisphaera setariae TaxID=2593304 RepID=A0A5C8ZG11_9ACTN|nr:DUF2207 domain-containing protein [Quadrisphaera setariae]TXR56777.1 DUF2207 domain-containing protein [Quadrisphaera setariae]
MSSDPVLQLATPAELGALHLRHAQRRHLAATVLDLAARGHLRVDDAGNDPTLGYALDWYLLLPGEAPPVGLDATDLAQVRTAHPQHEPWPALDRGAPRPGSADTLRSHERLLLTLVADTPNRLLSRVRAHADVPRVLAALDDDVVERGWFAPSAHALPVGLLEHLRGVHAGRRRTRSGDEVAAQLRAARSVLKAHRPEAAALVELLPTAVALGLLDLWTAHLGQLRPPTPAWFAPGRSTTARGWLGVCGVAMAMSLEPPPGGGAGSAAFGQTNP